MVVEGDLRAGRVWVLVMVFGLLGRLGLLVSKPGWSTFVYNFDDLLPVEPALPEQLSEEHVLHELLDIV